MEIKRVKFDNADYKFLVEHLDQELAEMDGKDHSFYHQFNQSEDLDMLLVGYMEYNPVSCGAYKVHDDTTVEIKRMYTLNAFRGEGYGINMLHALEAYAKDQGYTRCILETGSKQKAALGLYNKCAYTITPNYGQYVGVSNSTCFEKRLD